MNGAATNSPPLGPPSIAAYNVRYLSLSDNPTQREQWKRKVENVRCLADKHDIVAILETHVDGITAETFFCSGIDGTRRYYDDDIAILVNEKWHQQMRPDFVVVIPAVMVALTWHQGGLRHWVFLFRLDAHREQTRVNQLQRATEWAQQHVGASDWVAFLGDRNFVQHYSERESSSTTPWRPSNSMNAAWTCWLVSLAGSEEVPQAEFTWSRVVNSEIGPAGWTYEVLDVTGTNDIKHCPNHSVR